jgi:CDP-paratose 2-epimerase
MSCIYGPHQFGTEDQGWIAHFLIRARENGVLTLCGDGCQVRDVLYVGDLVEAFVTARQKIASLAGMAFNIGGGPRNTLSLRELIELLSEQHQLQLTTRSAPWRAGDQRYYVSDTRRFSEAAGWRELESDDSITGWRRRRRCRKCRPHLYEGTVASGAVSSRGVY